MKARKFFLPLFSLFLFFQCATYAIESSSIGIVSFPNCITESKYGKQEQEGFEQIRTQMTTLISDIEKQLQDTVAKFNDSEFVDSLSPEAEQELKGRFQSLQEEHQRYQQQYSQVMNQANMKILQMMTGHINTASSAIAKQKKLQMVVREEAFFYHEPTQDITTLVIAEMDNTFDKENPAAEMDNTFDKENPATVAAEAPAAPASE